jgi:hypothetical protein
VPFAVLRDPAESTLRALTEADLERVGRHVNLFAAKTTGEMTAALAGNVPGREVWKYLALCALAALIAEVAVARWVTGQRRTHTAEQVSFGTEPVSPQSLRDKLWERPASSAQEAGVRRQ